MSQPVSPWVWRRVLRQHGPESPGELLTLLIIGTYMNRTGEAYPSQSLVAAGARCSKRTVQRHVQLARRDGWLMVYLAGRGGQGWRHYLYQASVPDTIELDELDQELADYAEV